MTTMAEIEEATRQYAEAHRKLADLKRSLDDAILKLKRERLLAIRARMNDLAGAKSALGALIADGTDLFDKPRTRIFSGVKVGLQMGKPTIEWDDPDAVVARIDKLYDDQIGTLVRVKREPNKAALLELRPEDLKKLGCRRVDATDQVVIRSVESEIDKLVDALFRDHELDEVAEAAA